MMKGFYQYWTDLRSIFRHPLASICLFLYFIAILSVDLANLHTNPIHAIFIAKTYISPIAIGLALILSIRIYLMDLKLYSLSFIWGPIGKGLSAMTYMTIYTVITVAVFFENAHLWNLEGSILRSVISSLSLGLEVSFAFAISLGLLIASIFRNQWAYLVGILSWLFGSFLIPLILNNKPYLLPFSATPIINMSKNFETSWGLILVQHEEKSLWYTLLAFTLLCLIVTVLLTIISQPTKRLLTPFVALGLAIIFTVVNVTAHFKYWDSRFTGLKEHHAAAISVANTVPGHDAKVKVSDYQIDMFKDDDVWTINSRLHMTVVKPPADKKLSFTINPDFHVEQVSMNGRIVDFNETNGKIDVFTSGLDQTKTVQSMSFIYTGRLSEWGANSSGEEEWYAFTNDNTFYLPAHLAWYPLPGQVPLYFEKKKNVYQQNFESAITRDPVTYTIRLHNLDTHVFSTTLSRESEQNHVQALETTNQTGITLFGGDFKTWESKNVSAIIPAFYDHVRRPLTSEIDSLRDFLQETFNKPIRGKVVFLPMGGEMYKNNRDIGNALVYPSYKLNELTNGTIDGEMENEMIDYFLTGEKLLDTTAKRADNLNTVYVEAIKDLYHHDQGMDNGDTNKKIPLRQVANQIDNGNESLLKEFLRKLIKNQDDPKHPVITTQIWNSTWDAIFKNGA